MDKRFWAIIGIIIAIFAGILFVSSNKDEDKSGSSTAKPTSHIKGNTSAKVTLIEYGDFQCPFCKEYFPLVEQVTEKYKDQIAFQFRHLPLNQMHQNAYAAARASEAASDQGKFWEMYALLYQNQDAWSQESNVTGIFESYAKQLGLDATKFKKDFASREVNARINADKAEFNKTKEAVSTPTFFLNGKKIQAASLDEFSKLIDAELKKQK